MYGTPEINTDRLTLRAVRLDDAPDIYAYARNPNVLQYTTSTPPRALAETEEFVRYLLNKPEGEYAWSICLHPNPTVIGIIELGFCSAGTGSVDYALGESWWGRGLGTEALRSVIDWGFRTHATLQNIEGAALADNPASTRIQEKIGMSRYRITYRAWEKFDEPVELIVCRINREEWAAQPLKEPMAYNIQ